MATEKELELLDSYLANRLNTNEKTSFEQKLGADPNLKNEFEFQQRLIEGIRKARAAELKSMLKNIPISAVETGESTWVGKVITGCVIAGLLGTGFYFFMDKEKEDKNETAIIQENKVVDTKETTSTQETTQNQVPAAEEVRALKIEEKATSKSSRKKTDTLKATEEKLTEKRKIEVFDPTHEMESTGTQNNSEIESGSKATTSSIAVETDNTNKKYTFNYQFKNGNLLLYGSFEKNYEILEFVDQSKHTLFLFYKDNYYLLEDDNQKVKSLTPITDPVLSKKLKEHRGM